MLVVIVGTGNALIVVEMVLEAAVQPYLLVTVTVKSPSCFTLIVSVLIPVDHLKARKSVVSVTKILILSPAHIAKPLEAEIDGTVGGLTVTEIGLETAIQLELFVRVTL